ncbi:peptidase [Streptomyces fuscigenes]|uniref:peptidase n=1 Tax=Streptomyces fuscigenes TaxID=1528880 RepID=UPI001F1D6677|nr:peptidase [Streptomyces fuscigenes]MCF3960352.1 peptidase [Streptomyces fuscigenes]
MKIRRILATAVAAAVTTPVVMLCATQALAADGPSTVSRAQQQGEQDKPSLEELQQAAAKAQKAYDDALADDRAARAVLEAALSDDAPLAVAAKNAADAAADAATAKAQADQAVADAQAALAALPDTATAEEKAAAEKAVANAKTAAASAGTAKDAADAKAAAASTAREDARVAAAHAYSVVQDATNQALKAKEAADKALAAAQDDADPDCVYASKLSTVLVGLPSTIEAGSTTDFSVRVTNGTDKALGKVSPHLYFHATDKSGHEVLDDAFHLQWSTAASSFWQDVDADGDAGSISPLKAGAHADVQLRLKVDADAPAGDGVAFVAGSYVNDDKSCGGNLSTEYAFKLLAAKDSGGKPGSTGAPKPGKTGKATPPATHTSPQGGAATTPIDSPTPAATGVLASTGAPSALPQLAAASAAALVLGGGAAVMARRRRAGSRS